MQTTGRPTLRAFSAKAMGNRPLPASRPTGTTALNASILPSRGVLALGRRGHLGKLLLQGAKLAAQRRELIEAEQDALGLALRPGRVAQHALAGRHVAVQPRTGADDR